MPRAESTVERHLLEKASPEFVYEYLLSRRPDSHGTPKVPTETLMALRERNEALIDLAVAQIAVDDEMLGALYEAGDTGVRCAVLANPMLRSLAAIPVTPPESPTVMVGGAGPIGTEEKLAAFLAEADDELLHACLLNPKLSPQVLTIIFQRGAQDPTSFVDARWVRMLGLASQNPQLYKPVPPSRSFPPIREHDQDEALRAFWRLLDLAPVHSGWAYFLSDDGRQSPQAKLFRVPREGAFFEEALARWRDPSVCEASDNHSNYFGRLRSLISAHATSTLPVEAHGSLRDSNDLFVRIGYYRSFKPESAEEVNLLFNKDGERFCEGAVENRCFYLARRGEASYSSF